MKIITADHSGTIVSFQALVTREEAERLALDLKESYEVANDQWSQGPDLKCVTGQSPEDFLVKKSEEMECTYKGEVTNFYHIHKSNWKTPAGELYYADAHYEEEDQPASFDPRDSKLYFGNDGNECIFELNNSALDLDDLASRLL